MVRFVGTVEFGPDKLEHIQIECRVRSSLPILSRHVEADGSIRIPADHFAWDKRVVDEVVRVKRNNQLVPPENLSAADIGSVRPGCWILVLESPHHDEYYFVENEFLPVGPLRNPDTLRKFHKHIDNLCREIGQMPEGTALVLCNPVPYQASLDRLMVQPTRLHRAVRNAVWKELFLQGFRREFAERLAAYQPSVVINACTYDLRAFVKKALREIREAAPHETPEAAPHGSFRHITCNKHPCIWLSAPSWSEEPA
jgi:hypothetical protein